jgi:hypothetical protein
MVTELVIALHVEFIVNHILILKVSKCSQVRLLQLKFDKWHDFANLLKVFDVVVGALQVVADVLHELVY